MRAMMTAACMTAAAVAAGNSSCTDMGLLLDAVLASVFAILGILLGLRGFLLALVGVLSIILRCLAAGPKDALPRFA